MKNEPQTKEEICRLLSETYVHFIYDELMKYNEAQLYTLFSACKDEDGELSRFPKKEQE